MENFNELLKDAIACNDFHFLEMNKHKYDINHRFPDEDHDTLLLYAISDPESDTYSFFIENGADITLVNDQGEGIIHSIVYSGLVERIAYILNQPLKTISLLNIQTKEGVTPLLLSVLLEKIDIFDFLLNMGADVNLSDNTGNSPLHPACFEGHKEMVLRLVENGANLRSKTQKGNYPLTLAINGDHDEIAKYLFHKIYD